MKKWLYLLVTIIVIACLAIFAGLSIVNSSKNQTLKLENAELLVVQQGQYAHYLINRLAERGIIENPVAIKVALKLTPALARVKSGTYEIGPDMSVEDLFAVLSTGQEKQFSVQLIEGLRWSDWQSQLNSHAYLSAGPDNEAEWLKLLDEMPQGQKIEGWLLPETYYFTAHTKASEVFIRAHSDMRAYLEDAWLNRALDLPYDSPYEALIMASIIEKETGLASERPRISGVFVNRLRLGMRLQTDPTVIYGMGDTFDGDIRRKDLRTQTPYNTYVIQGLPPTPIAMPSKLAIDAAMHPLETDELYFVAKGDGSHKFSKTLAEHNQAVRKYQLKK